MSAPNDPADQIEALIDAHGAGSVLEAFASVCRAKADHIRSNWQDKVTAQGWDMAASRVERVVQYVKDVAS